MKKKNVCIVGYGAIGPIHARAVSEIDSVRLFGVCDIDKERTALCKSEYSVAEYSDFDEMLKDGDIDSVHICTPHYLHFEMIKKALESGKQVVCEKPAVMTREEFNELKKIKGVENVCFVLQNRQNPCVVELKKMIEENTLGTLRGVKGIMSWKRTREYYNSASWRGKWATEGGGVLINQSIHTLDLMVYLAGKVSTLKANMINYSLEDTIEVEDTFTAYLNYDSGIKGIFFATNAYSTDDTIQLSFDFEKGRADYILGKLFVNNMEVCTNNSSSIGKSCWGNGHLNLIKRFYQDNEYYNIHDIENSMRAMFAMYESAKNNGKEREI